MFNIRCCHRFPLDHCALLYQVNIYLREKLHFRRPANRQLNNRVIGFHFSQSYTGCWAKTCDKKTQAVATSSKRDWIPSSTSSAVRQRASLAPIQTNSHRGCSDLNECIALFKCTYVSVFGFFMSASCHSFCPWAICRLACTVSLWGRWWWLEKDDFGFTFHLKV